MNDLSSAWHCTACARLHLFRAPSPQPMRCEDCGNPELSDAGPTSGFGDLNRADAPRTDPVDVAGASHDQPDVARLIAEARRLRGEARVVSISLREVLFVTASLCAASREARAGRSDAPSATRAAVRRWSSPACP